MCPENGVERLLEYLDKSYAVDTTNQGDKNLFYFLAYTWKRTIIVEQYLDGVHSRLDKIASLNLDHKLKGNLLPRQGSFKVQYKNMPYSGS